MHRPVASVVVVGSVDEEKTVVMRSSVIHASTKAKVDLSPARTSPVQQPQDRRGLAATTAWIFTFPVVIIQLVRVAWMILCPPIGYDRGAQVKNIGYAVAMVINGSNLLRGHEDHVYISAGFSYLIGILIPATTLLRPSIFLYFGIRPGKSFFPLIVHRVWGLCSLVATASAFHAGFFEGRDSFARSPQRPLLEKISSHDWPEPSGGESVCTAGRFPKNAPRSAKVTWYATIAVIAAHVALLVWPTWKRHGRMRSIVYVFAFSLPSSIVFVAGGILLRSYRKVTYRSAGYLYLLTAFCHVDRMESLKLLPRLPAFAIASLRAVDVSFACVCQDIEDVLWHSKLLKTGACF